MDTTDTAEPAVIINDIHKEFILPQSKNTSFKQVAVNIVKKNDKITQKVLDGVTFTVNKGDFFGIVGRNGEGKSTLLKLIAGVYSPTQGSITLNGGLTPFIELGVGFNPELSGRDNVFLNGALLGYDRKQMEAMYDEIVSFAELEPFMDQKLKNYSSGMQVRLAFSIAIKAKNDILIFDEVLAVGDEAFQRKCLDVFERYKATGQTVILVTHDMDTVKKYCNRAALISKGKLLRVGDPIRVADDYSRLNQLVIDEEIKKRNDEEEELEEAEDDRGIKLAVKRGDEQSSSFAVNEVATVSMDWDQAPEIDRILLDLYKNTGEHVCNFITSREGLGSLSEKSHADIDITLNLAPGSYRFAASFWSKDFGERLGGIAEAGEFIVTKDWSRAKHEFAGTTLLDSHWRE